MADEEFVTNDNTTVVYTCRDQNGSIIDLTGYTATIRFKNGARSTESRGMSVQNPPTLGKVEYRWADSDLSEGGTVRAEITLSKGGADITTPKLFEFSVRSRL